MAYDVTALPRSLTVSRSIWNRLAERAQARGTSAHRLADQIIENWLNGADDPDRKDQKS